MKDRQFKIVNDLPGKPLQTWGETPEEVAENEDLCVFWVTMSVRFGGIALKLDAWMFAEFHHWHAPFVFNAGTDELLLQYEPIEFVNGGGDSDGRDDEPRRSKRLRGKAATTIEETTAEQLSDTIAELLFAQMDIFEESGHDEHVVDCHVDVVAADQDIENCERVQGTASAEASGGIGCQLL
jgi:hypothetical protein